MDDETIRTRVAAAMPGLIDELARLVAIPSIAFPGHPPEPLDEMAAVMTELLQGVGVRDARPMPAPTGYPPVYGEVAGPPGSPVVLLYGHYDVQPAPVTQGWSTDPWVLTPGSDGRLYGRGAADDKGGLVAHLATLAVFDGRPPCTVKVLLEGMEETSSNLEEFVENNAELVDCDVFVVCDMGNLRAGEPVLTTTLRGDVACVVTVSTLQHPLHSGVFGGAAPDALMCLVRLLSTLVDENGDVAVRGVDRFAWTGTPFGAEDFAASADLLDGVRLVGSGPVADRLWSQPSISAIGLDTTTVAGSSNVLLPQARAKLSMRIVPGSDPEGQLDALVTHLREHAPWGAHVEVERVKAAPGFVCDTAGPGVAAARRALGRAYGRPAGEAGSGGSIPLLRTLATLVPRAEFVLWGPEDVARARIHASDESVDPQEIARVAEAQAMLLVELAAGRPAGQGPATP